MPTVFLNFRLFIFKNTPPFLYQEAHSIIDISIIRHLLQSLHIDNMYLWAPMQIRHLSTHIIKEPIVTEQLGKIITIGINRPEKRNCIDQKTAQLLSGAIENFENDDNLVAGILHGIGGNFCAGYDLKEMAACESNIKDLFATSGNMGPTQRYIRKPLIAAISGFAVAGGFELALMCDLRVVDETAVLGMYNRRFGVPLIDGGTVRLTAMVGLSRALDLILTGRSIEAKEAFEWGLANRHVACGTALGQAINLAMSLIKFPQKCMLQDRSSTYNAAFGTSLDRLLEYERINGWKVIDAESIAGAKKFIAGIGRHGKNYDLTAKEIPSWEKEQ